jgi:hypothetical protein
MVICIQPLRGGFMRFLGIRAVAGREPSDMPVYLLLNIHIHHVTPFDALK